MSVELLLDRTKKVFPDYQKAGVEIVPLEKGGSTRKYYRIRFGASFSLILVKYNLDKEENRRFVPIALLFGEVGIKAPEIYFHDPEEGLVWMEDLGEEELWQHRQNNWSIRRKLYQKTLDQTLLLHRLDIEESNRLHLMSGFDEGLYQWEQSYCIENCLIRYFRCLEAEHLKSEPALKQLSIELASYPMVLVHRDLQSQNVIIHQNNAYLIDFQGMRTGLRQYDLASLLCDPYVSLTETERDELLRYYYEKSDATESWEQFNELYCKCAIQRLMQALGAYGYLGLVLGKSEFLHHIAPALATLRVTAAKLAGFEFLVDFFERLPSPSQSRA
jgi:N-acetylmuramate 1-kinase